MWFVKAVGIGILNGFKWYGRRIKESRWYLIPLAIDVVLIPVKIVVVPLACLTRTGRQFFLDIGTDMETE